MRTACSGLASAPCRPALVATVLLLLSLALTDIHAETHIFTSCAALKRGFRTSRIRDTAEDMKSFCEESSKTILDEAVTHKTDHGSDDAGSKAPDTLPSGASVAVSYSSFGKVPFTVKSTKSDEKDFVAKTELKALTNEERPDGAWHSISSVQVSASQDEVWDATKDLVYFFNMGLDELSATVKEVQADCVRATFTGSGSLEFIETESSDEKHFKVFRMQDIADDVFPGFDFEGVLIYVQVLGVPPTNDVTVIEMGWAPPVETPVENDDDEEAELEEVISVVKERSAGDVLLDTVLMEILLNLARHFGELCELFRERRTIEGDCNNLQNPTQASAGEPLRRLGNGDPAYPDGDRTQPSGPVNISAREISNALFSSSPGASLVAEQAETLNRRCFRGTTGAGDTVEVCPFRFIVIESMSEETRVPFVRLARNRFEEVVMVFRSINCRILVVLKCSGESIVDFADSPCGSDENRLFTPVACTLIPGRDSVLANSDGLTDLFFSFGQFIDHDVGLSPLSQLDEKQPGFSRLARPPVNISFPIEIPERDFHFDDREEFEFTRASFSEVDPNSQVNLHSSYLDGSHIYGVNFRRALLLRTFRGGRLLLSDNNLPPFNGPDSLGAFVENGPNMDSRFFVVGDSRGNEQTLLLALHIIFLREHNRVADELAEAFPDYDDELLYQTARAIVIAEFQVIVYKEWLPLLLGSNSPDPRDFKYDENLDASVSAIFTTSAFRFGHSMVGTNLLSLGPGPRTTAKIELLPIRDVFFLPELVSDEGVDPFLRGGAWHRCKELDNLIVDEVRNFLTIEFELNDTDPPNFDLISLNLQRGRDVGLPSYNVIRTLFGLEERTSFSEFISDRNLADLAEEVYGNVNVAEIFFGGLAEAQVPGSQLGETFNTIIASQFTRLRDGDRFFYTGVQFAPEVVEKIPVVQQIENDSVRLADVILRNTGIEEEELGTGRDSVFQLRF